MATPKKRTPTTVRLLIAVVALGCVAWFVHLQWARRQAILAENQAVGLQNEGRYAEAVKAYEALLPKAKGEQAQRLRSNLARCYASLAEEPALPWSEALELYRKAHGLDPAAVTNPAILKRIETGQ